LIPKYGRCMDSKSFAKKLTQAGRKTDYLLLTGMAHKDTVLALADGNSALFKAVLAMIEASP
jgi:hypothetical protein